MVISLPVDHVVLIFSLLEHEKHLIILNVPSVIKARKEITIFFLENQPFVFRFLLGHLQDNHCLHGTHVDHSLHTL
jgi:hypothetical protein